MRDGKIIADAEEERFSRLKHDNRFPEQAIDYCLDEGGITADELDYVVFYDKPFLNIERILESYLEYTPLDICSFLMVIPLWEKKKLWIPDEYSSSLIKYPPHLHRQYLLQWKGLENRPQQAMDLERLVVYSIQRVAFLRFVRVYKLYFYN